MEIFSIFAADGKAAVFLQLQREILRHFPIRTHKPSTVHIPEPTVHTCRGQRLHSYAAVDHIGPSIKWQV